MPVRIQQPHPYLQRMRHINNTRSAAGKAIGRRPRNPNTMRRSKPSFFRRLRLTDNSIAVQQALPNPGLILADNAFPSAAEHGVVVQMDRVLFYQLQFHRFGLDALPQWHVAEI